MWWSMYLVVITLTSIGLMGADKKRAKKRGSRISERTLFTLALIGGGVGIYIGMKMYRHKTKHTKFTVGIPFIILAQVVLLALTIYVYQTRG